MFKTNKVELPKVKPELRNILRWEDDGGTISAINSSKPDRHFVQPVQPASHDPSALGAVPKKGETHMNKRVGLWINRNKAVIVRIADNIEAKTIITSDMEHYDLYSTVVPGDGAPENVRDRRFWKHLGEYYDKIIAYIGNAAEIQIFGPDGAKYELQKHLESRELAEYIVSVEDAERMTDLEIATKVQNRFPLRSRFDIP